jgi:hypothetical protein
VRSPRQLQITGSTSLKLTIQTIRAMMAVNIDPNEVWKLIRFLNQYGISNMNDYQFVLAPSFRGLNLKVDLNVTYLPQNKTLTVTLDP